MPIKDNAAVSTIQLLAHATDILNEFCASQEVSLEPAIAILMTAAYGEGGMAIVNVMKKTCSVLTAEHARVPTDNRHERRKEMRKPRRVRAATSL